MKKRSVNSYNLNSPTTTGGGAAQKYFKLSNRLTYTLIVVGVFILIGFGVFAFNTSNPSHFGHSSGELIVNWNDIQGKPSGFADNVDNDRYRQTIPWTSITGMPSGFADGIDNVGSSRPPTPTPPTPTCDKSQGSTTRCNGNYEVTEYTDSDCSDERTFCLYGCSGRRCNSAPTLVTEIKRGSGKWRGSGWHSKTLNCPSGFSALSCTSSLFGGGWYADAGDGDETKCIVHSSHCKIYCREAHTGLFDDYECGVSGSCTCQGYV